MFYNKVIKLIEGIRTGADGLMAMIPPSQGGDPGSIPGRRILVNYKYPFLVVV